MGAGEVPGEGGRAARAGGGVTGAREVRAQGAEISAPALGMILFIASEVMFFAGLFGAYFTIRGGATGWPPAGTAELEIWIPAAATVLLMVSSVTMHAAAEAAGHGRDAATARWLLITIALGALFLGGQAFEYSQLDFTVSDHSYGTLFYSMTGFHALHVFAGLVMLGLVWIKTSRGHLSHGRSGPVVAAGLYWHFVDVVWILLFATLYLLR